MNPDQVRADAVRQYARLRRDKTGPAVCVPPRKIVDQRHADGVDPIKRKLIFDTPDKARDFMAACAELGDEPLRIYECPFSRHGHVHLTSKPLAS